MTTSFTPVASLLGGALIGLSASGLLLLLGRIAGISGIAGGLLTAGPRDIGWRVAFLAGLVAGGALSALAFPSVSHFQIPVSTTFLIVGGLFVGYGTRLGNGCTSGHGVCGLSRLSLRSLVATLCFMASGFATVFVLRHWWGGGS